MKDWIEVDIPTHRMKDAIWVKCIAEIRKNDIGEVREIETDEVLKNGSETPNIFNWEENNFSCDCNRAIFFGRANGEELDEPCSDGKYSVNLKNAKDGKIYYREFT